MEKCKTKTVYATALPYTETPWPSISLETADAIVQLLVPLLKPIGDSARDRISNPTARKMKSAKRRKSGEPSEKRPEISSHLNVGFNSTVRVLEELAGDPAQGFSTASETEAAVTAAVSSGYPAVIFVCQAALPGPVCQSIPILVATASQHKQNAEPLRLVGLSLSAEAAVSAALGLPRVSVLAVHHGAPGTGPLSQFVREHVEPIKVPWLHEVFSSSYLPVKVNAVEVAVGGKKSSRKRKADQG